MHDKNIKRHERGNRYDLFMKNKPITKVLHGKEVIYRVNIHMEKEGLT
ncbi:hypothetical protein [Bacillus toyonensis]|nr:hypothetical protein [Bacillus toyonensis]AFU17845.1 hypothetical protein MC28_G112 [Bacillus thuringiensis MC28]QQN86562.1 hypothetical protein I0K03_27075 [Bacillus toyonensis]